MYNILAIYLWEGYVLSIEIKPYFCLESENQNDYYMAITVIEPNFPAPYLPALYLIQTSLMSPKFWGN